MAADNISYSQMHLYTPLYPKQVNILLNTLEVVLEVVFFAAVPDRAPSDLPAWEFCRQNLVHMVTRKQVNMKKVAKRAMCS
ncbi:hypothetical protein HMPREF2909_08565 [Alloscardovia sp. HMSC034E08]|nr:hypothetical protein HMPREF2909_08565 [Alloscardovia sp. HMSC034E08]